MVDPSKSSPFDGWQGWAHPCSPAGGGGPGNFRPAQPLGCEPWYSPSDVHPRSAVGISTPVPPLRWKDEITPTLELIDESIGGYNAVDLNAALETTFGEISSKLVPDLKEEAVAVASTIFNRLEGIAAARAAWAKEAQLLPPLMSAAAQAEAAYDELAKHPSKYKAELKGEYVSKTAQASLVQKEAKNARERQLKVVQAANDKKIAMESYVAQSRRNAVQLTLADIVAQRSQYEGTAKGIDDFNAFPKMPAPDQARNLERWKTARDAIKTVAPGPASRKPYLAFQANRDRKTNALLKLQSGQTRIGGNDFH